MGTTRAVVQAVVEETNEALALLRSRDLLHDVSDTREARASDRSGTNARETSYVEDLRGHELLVLCMIVSSSGEPALGD